MTSYNKVLTCDFRAIIYICVFSHIMASECKTKNVMVQSKNEGVILVQRGLIHNSMNVKMPWTLKNIHCRSWFYTEFEIAIVSHRPYLCM